MKLYAIKKSYSGKISIQAVEAKETKKGYKVKRVSAFDFRAMILKTDPLIAFSSAETVVKGEQRLRTKIAELQNQISESRNDLAALGELANG